MLLKPIRALGAGAVVWSAALLQTASAAPARAPNIVLILADDLGYGDIGCQGATKVKTPNMDRLAREGRRFTDAHAASAVCTPSRYALLTGEYPFRRNLWGPAMNPSPLLIDPATTTLPGMLKRQGYATACIGKWHLGFGSQPKPDWNADLKPGPLELGFKFDAWEGGHRVPFIVRWPGRVEAGSRSDQLLSLLDLPATLASMTGYARRPGEFPDSLDLLPVLTGTPPKSIRERLVIGPRHGKNLAIREGHWLYIGAQNGGGFGEQAGHRMGGAAAFPFTGRENSDIAGGRIKPAAPPAQLYDLAADPAQRVNVIHDHPEIAERLRRQRDACLELAARRGRIE
jgi:arylsulfatase A-like enzyme